MCDTCTWLVVKHIHIRESSEYEQGKIRWIKHEVMCENWMRTGKKLVKLIESGEEKYDKN